MIDRVAPPRLAVRRRSVALHAWACAASLFAGCGGPVSALTDGPASPDLNAAVPADAGTPMPDAAAPVDTGAALAAPTYANFAQGFFTSYCISCHPAGSATQDYSKYADIKRDHALIACGVNPGPDPLPSCTASSPQPKQFPVGSGPFPSDDERGELVAWIAAGLPQ